MCISSAATDLWSTHKKSCMKLKLIVVLQLPFISLSLGLAYGFVKPSVSSTSTEAI